jgi:hypothetical protein
MATDKVIGNVHAVTMTAVGPNSLFGALAAVPSPAAMLAEAGG